MKPEEIFNLIKNATYVTVGDDVQYTIEEQEDGIYLLFQQSASEEDWKVNFDFPVTVYKEQTSVLFAHRGYVKTWKQINDEVLNKFIYILDKTGKEPFICGWSYGGAMSVLAAEDFYYRTTYKPTMITFGAPKVMWGKKCKNYVASCISDDSRQYRHVNDLVPCLPPFTGYTQVLNNFVGTGKNFFKLFNPWKYHTMYGDSTLY